jgi:DNA-binding MarR family transcriptional regulator
MDDGPDMRGASRSQRAGRRRVDLGPLPGLIGFMLRRAQIAVFQEIFRAFADAGIRPAQFSVLIVIEHNPGLTQTEVSAALGIKRTNFVALIDGLEQRGLAERKRSATDRRSHALYLTEAGQATMRQLQRAVDSLEARLIGRIGRPGRDHLLALLRQLAGSDQRGSSAAAPARPRAVAAGTRAQAKRKRSITSRSTG